MKHPEYRTGKHLPECGYGIPDFNELDVLIPFYATRKAEEANKWIDRLVKHSESNAHRKIVL